MQWNEDTLREVKYVIMLGPLHIEMAGWSTVRDVLDALLHLVILV